MGKYNKIIEEYYMNNCYKDTVRKVLVATAISLVDNDIDKDTAIKVLHRIQSTCEYVNKNETNFKELHDTVIEELGLDI